jgi:peptidoglycan glycosyltransferase
MARVAGTIAADGMLAPQRYLLTDAPPDPAVRIVNAESAQFLQDAMRDVVKRGTAASRALMALEIAGKTGTAQWKRKATDHAWFVGYAPLEDRRVAFAILVAEGGGGGRTAAPISGEIISAIKLKKTQ